MKCRLSQGWSAGPACSFAAAGDPSLGAYLSSRDPTLLGVQKQAAGSSPYPQLAGLALKEIVLGSEEVGIEPRTKVCSGVLIWDDLGWPLSFRHGSGVQPVGASSSLGLTSSLLVSWSSWASPAFLLAAVWAIFFLASPSGSTSGGT